MEIVTDIEQLGIASKPIEFITPEEIDQETPKAIVEKLKAAMEEHPEILALAAPQIGEQVRAFCIRFDDALKFFINPIITRKRGQTVLPETCASFPKSEFIIGRPTELTAVYYNENLVYETNKFLDAGARVFDQMCQLLDGVTPQNFGMESNVDEDGYWKDASEEDLKVAQKFYLEEFAPKLLEAYKRAINEDPELASQYKQLNFTESVINDKVQVVDMDETKDIIMAHRAMIKSKRQGRKAAYQNFIKGKK